MRRPLRLALAAAVYGAASLTGGWLGTPPWYEEAQYDGPESQGRLMDGGYNGGPFVSVTLVLAGLGPAAFALRSHKPRLVGPR